MMNTVVARSVTSIEQFWGDKTRQLQLLKQIEKKLNIKQPIDWYRFQRTDLIKGDQRTSVILEQYNNSLGKLLSSLYPEVKWDLTR
jgi:hypothetical protein